MTWGMLMFVFYNTGHLSVVAYICQFCSVTSLPALLIHVVIVCFTVDWNASFILVVSPASSFCFFYSLCCLAVVQKKLVFSSAFFCVWHWYWNHAWVACVSHVTAWCVIPGAFHFEHVTMIEFTIGYDPSETTQIQK